MSLKIFSALILGFFLAHSNFFVKGQNSSEDSFEHPDETTAAFSQEIVEVTTSTSPTPTSVPPRLTGNGIHSPQSPPTFTQSYPLPTISDSDSYDEDFPDPLPPSVPSNTGNPFAYPQLVGRMYQVVKEFAELRNHVNRRDSELYNFMKSVNSRVSQLQREDIARLENSDKEIHQKIEDLSWSLNNNFTSIRTEMAKSQNDAALTKQTLQKEDADIRGIVTGNQDAADKKFASVRARQQSITSQAENLIRRNYNLIKSLHNINSRVAE